MVRIVCEGKSDKIFLKLLLDYLKINVSDNNFITMGSKTYLLNSEDEKYEILIKQIEIGKISKLLFLLDADSNFTATEISVQETIQELGFTDISEYIVICNPQTKEGYLESLILETIPEEHKKCIESFLECSKTIRNDKHIVKSLYKEYYPSHGYNFEHENFKPLIDKLKKLFNKEA